MDYQLDQILYRNPTPYEVIEVSNQNKLYLLSKKISTHDIPTYIL